MAGKKTAAPPPGPPQVPPAKGVELLEKQIGEAETLLLGPIVSSAEKSAWWAVTERCLEKAFGSGAKEVDRVASVGERMSFPMNASDAWWNNARREAMNAKVTMLRALQSALQSEADELLLTKPVVVPAKPQASAKRAVFLVHGHDERYLHETENFLRKLKLSVIILRDQANQGRTIIEKFEDHAGEAGFAVVLLTPDDLGRSKAEASDVLRPRARQNAVMELGWFLAKLGRSHVCALHSGHVELPSDFAGVLYVSLDDGTWKYLLAKELRAAGLPVDMNDV
jgi:predicted nucleotide-binding protein